MILISHRGNLEGKQPEQENNPLYIYNALNKGYEVEIDVWYKDNELRDIRRDHLIFNQRFIKLFDNYLGE